MQHSFFHLFALFLLVVFSTAPAKAQQTVHLDKLGLSLTLPEGWERKHYTSGNHAGPVSESSTPDVAFATYIQFQEKPADEMPIFRMLNIEQHSYLNWFQRYMWAKGWNTKKDSRYELVAQIPTDDPLFPFAEGQGFIYRQPVQGDDGLFVRLLVYYVVQDGRCYRFVIGGAENRFDEDKALYQTMLQSIQFDA